MKLIEDLRNIVSPETYQAMGTRSIDKIDKRLIATLNAIEKQYGYTLVCNTWHRTDWKKYGEIRKYSGYRPEGCGVGAAGGAHYLGMAVDLLVYDSIGNRVNDDNFRSMIMRDIVLYPFIQCLEVKIPWSHIDTMTQQDNPKRIGCDGSKVMLVDTTNNVTWLKR